jgi:hypothetical protein
MGRSVKQALPVRPSRGIRRATLMLLAFVYLFVGIVHNISCLDQAVATQFAIANASDVSDDGGMKSGAALCDHCPTCVPAVMPSPGVAIAPSALPSPPVVAVAAVLIASHPRLDTPPPKHLT